MTTPTGLVLPVTGDRVRYPKWIAGRYYTPRSLVSGAASSAALTANTIYGAPLWVPPGGRIDRIGINVSGAAAAGKVARFMLHRPGADDLPGSLLLDAGTVLVDGTGDALITVDYTPPPGLLWISVVSDGTPTVALLGTTGMVFVHGTTTVSGTATGGPTRALGNALAPDPWGTPGAYLTGGYVAPGVRAV